MQRTAWCFSQMLCRVAENCCVVLLKMRLFRGKAANRQSQVRRPVREEFDADLAIQKMMASGHWPRREYMRGASVMSPSENKTHWSASAEVAARRGTWTHLQCECVLNGGSVDGVCPELALLAIFLGRTKPLLASRTEWCIWATKEKVAGCIDFAAIDERPPGVSWLASPSVKWVLLIELLLLGLAGLFSHGCQVGGLETHCESGPQICQPLAKSGGAARALGGRTRG